MSVTVTLTWLRSLTVVVKRDDLSHDFPLLIVLIAQGEVMLGRELHTCTRGLAALPPPWNQLCKGKNDGAHSALHLKLFFRAGLVSRVNWISAGKYQ